MTPAVRRAAPPGGRLASVQVLRAVAVMMVAAYHATLLAPDPSTARHAVPAALYFGYAGVDLFFLISGFVIMHATRRPGLDVREFAWKRVFRILPPYWLVTGLLAAIWLVRPALVPVRGEPLPFLLGSLLLLPGRERPLLGVGWTLQHEFMFYALMAVLLTLGRRRSAAPILFALFAAGALLHVAIDPVARWWDWKLLSLYSGQFGLGVLAYAINAGWRLRPAAALLAVAIGAGGFAAVAAIATPLMPGDLEVPVVPVGAFGLVRVTGYGIAAFLVLLGALSLDGEGRARPGWPGRAAIAVGDASFSIYLTHNLVIQAAARLTRPVSSPATWPIAAAAVLVAVALVGMAAHRLIERPLIAWCERRLLPRLTGHGVATPTLAAER